MSNYVEMTLSKFIMTFPSIVPELVKLNIDLSDPEYIVRFNDSGFEIGYCEDPFTLE